jgi:Protein of unknown function (DUF1501)
MQNGLDHAANNARCLSRRRLLQLGGLGCLGLSLPRLFQAQAAKAALPAAVQTAARIRSCILIFYYGGPSHLDMFDLKPHAPAEVRGEFKPAATTVPGLRISEHLPWTARVMHKVALIRSMHHAMRNHDSACTETLTGREPFGGDRENFTPLNDLQVFPCYGASLTYARKGASKVPHAALPFAIHNAVPVPCQTGGFLGSTYNPFAIEGDPETLGYRADLLKLPESFTPARVGRRKALLGRLDAARERSPAHARPLRKYYQKAFDLLGSEAVRRALDIDQEPGRVRDRYGRGLGLRSFPDDPVGGNGAQLGYGRGLRGQNLLLARRLVEAGVPFVNVYDFKQQGQNWDSHVKNFGQLKNHLLPPADRAFSALIEDLDARGLLDTTLVVALGEFGRTPRINKDAGRDHWPDCYSALVAGGGVKGGMVYGSSDKNGAYPASDPVTPADLAATIFWRFGLDPATEIHDVIGRPYRLAEGEPLRKLFA